MKRNSVHNEEELIGYHHTKDTIEDKLGLAIIRFNEVEEARKRMMIQTVKPDDDNVIDEMRSQCKEEKKRLRNMNAQSLKNQANTKFSGAISKVRMMRLMGSRFKNQNKRRRSVNMNHINHLYDGDKLKHFQQKGINDPNFIGMING